MFGLTSLKITNFQRIATATWTPQTTQAFLLGVNLDSAEEQRSNGAGKSSLIGAVQYCLFGVTPEGRRKDDVIRLGEKTVEVTGVFQHSQGVLTVTRSKNRGSSEELVVLLNNEITSPQSLAKAQEYLDSVLGFGAEEFQLLACIKGDLVSRFGESADKEKRSFLETFIPAKFMEVRDQVERQAKDATAAVAGTKAKQFHLDGQIDANKESLACARSDHAKLEETLQNLPPLAESTPFSPEQLQALTKFEGELANGLATAKTELARSLEATKSKRATLEQEQAKLARELSKLADSPVELCPTCHQPWEGAAAHLKEKMEEARTKQEEVATALEKLALEDAETTTGIKDLLAYKELVLTPTSNKVAAITTDLKTQQTQYGAVQQEERRRAQLQGTLEEKSAQLERLAQTINTLEKERAELEVTVKKQVRDEAILAYWKNAFSGKSISSLILQHYLDELTIYVNDLLADLFTETFSVAVNAFTQKKSGDISAELSILFTTDAGVQTYNMLSDGEKRRVDLAFMLAFRKLFIKYRGLEFDFLFLDEVFRGVDTPGCARIITALQELCSNLKVVVVSHRNDLQNLFEQVMIVERKNGVSRLLGA